MSRLDLNLIRIRAGLIERAAELAIDLLGEPNRAISGRRELRFGRHGSLGVIVAGPKAGLWHDHEAGAGGDLFALIMRCRGGGFQDAVQFAAHFPGRAHFEPAPRDRVMRVPVDDAVGCTDKTRIALDIWNHAGPMAGTIAADYLASRGIREFLRDLDGAVLRFHPRCSYDGARRPCLVALLRDVVTNEPRGIQRTALTPDGRKIGRRTLGPKSHCAIKLSANADVVDHLTIGEGCETVLAGMLLGYRPAWAVGDAGELAAFPILPGIESITILVDHDESGTGQRAALECSARWTAAGREVFRLVPRQAGADVNDLLVARRGAA